MKKFGKKHPPYYWQTLLMIKKSLSFLCFFVWGDDDTFDPVSQCHMSASSCPVNLTAQNPQGKGSWVLCQTQRGGWRKAGCSVCACVGVWLYVWLCVRVHVCQFEGMDACQRREQHHVKVLADDARFRYTNSKSQLSHETISSHDSSTPFLSASHASAGYRKVKKHT